MKEEIVACALDMHVDESYLEEWASYCKTIGISKAYLYMQKQPASKPLKRMVKDKFLIICKAPQDMTMSECYEDYCQKYRSLHAWTWFAETDEYLTMLNFHDVMEYLHSDMIHSADVVKLNFVTYGDFDKTTIETLPLYKRFAVPLPAEVQGIDPWPFNAQVSCIIRNTVDIVKWHGRVPEYADASTTNGCGQHPHDIDRPYKVMLPIEYSQAFVRKYYTKTISEWLRDKCDGLAQYSLVERILEFFKLNKMTPEKLSIVRKFIEDRYGK